MEVKREPTDFSLAEEISIKEGSAFANPSIKAEQTKFRSGPQLKQETLGPVHLDWIKTEIDTSKVPYDDYFINPSDLAKIKKEVDDEIFNSKLLPRGCELLPVKNECDVTGFLGQPSTNKNAQIRLQKEKVKKKRKYSCLVCQKRFARSLLRKCHFNLHFRKCCVTCILCGKIFKQPELYLSHYFFHFIKIRKGVKSNLEESKVIGLTAGSVRIVYNMGSKRPFECGFCFKRFVTSTKIKIHIRHHTGEKPFKCRICSKGFVSNNLLTQHMLSHTDEKSFKCEVCSKGFKQKGNLKKHMLCHTGEKPFQCEICLKHFRMKNHLKAHVLSHVHDKPIKCEFKCKICLKAFLSNCYLNRHMSSHTGEKSFKCDICEKGFSQKGNLKKHMLCHTGEKPFRCEVCFKNFRMKDHLKGHVLSHTGEKPFNCEMCYKQFSRKTDLTRHMKTHLNRHESFPENYILNCVSCQKVLKNNSVDCDICDKTLQIKSALNTHLKKPITETIFCHNNKHGKNLTEN